MSDEEKNRNADKKSRRAQRRAQREARRRRRSFIRRAGKFAVMGGLFFAFAVTLVSVAGYYIITYPTVQEKIIAFAEEKISELILGDVSIGKIETNILSYINIYDVKAVGKSEFRDSAYVGSVRINYWLGLGTLLNRHIHINSAHVSDVRGHVVMESDEELGGRIMLPFLPMKLLDSNYNMLSKFETHEFEYREFRRNLEDYKKIPRHLRQTLSTDMPDPRSWPVQISVGRAQVDGISAVYRDLQNNMVGEIKNASASARFYEIDSFSVRLNVPHASYESPWWNGTVDTLRADGVITWSGLEVQDMLMSGSGTRVTGRGKLSYFPDGPWDMTANIRTLVDPLPILFEHTPQLSRGATFEGTASYRGRLYDPVWSANLNGRNVNFAGIGINQMNVNATFGEDEIGRARIRGTTDIGGFDVNATVAMPDIVFGPETFGDYSATVNLADLDMETILAKFDATSPFTINGGNVLVNAGGTNFEMPHEAAVSVHANVGGIYDVDLRGVVRQNGAFTLSGDLGLGENHIASSGRINLETGDVRGSATVSLTDPMSLTNALFGEAITGHIVAEGEYAFALANAAAINGSADLTGEEVGWRGLIADSLEAKIKFASGVATLESANGSVAGPIDWAAQFFELDMLVGDIAADFSVHGDLGKIENLFANVYFRGSDMQYGDVIADTIRTFATMDSGKVRWNNLYVRGMGLALESAGNFAFYPHMELHAASEIYHIRNDVKSPAGNIRFDGTIIDDRIAANYRALNMPLVMLDAWIPEEHRSTGSLSLEGTLGGTISNPAARISYRVEEPKYADKIGAHVIAGDAELSDSLASTRATLMLRPDAAPIELSANIPLTPSNNYYIDDASNRTAFFHARTTGLDINHVKEILNDLAVELADIESGGTITFDIHAINRLSSGVISNDNNNNNIADNNITNNINDNINANNITNNNASIKTSEINTWTLGGTLNIPDGTLRYIPIDANVNRVRLSANMGGTLENPRASFSLITGRARTPEFRIDRTVVTGVADLEAITVDSANLSIEDGNLIARGKMFYDASNPNLQNGNINAAFNIVDVPVEVFANFVPELEFDDGTISANGNITGTPERPLVSGEMRIREVNFGIRDISPVVGPVEANIAFADSTINLLWLTGRWGRGYLSAEGSTNWNVQGFQNTNINSTINNISFELPEVIEVGLDRAELQIVDQGGGFLIRGRATLGQTNYVRDVSVLEMINQAQLGAVHRVPNPFLEQVRLQVDLNLDENMSIDMNLGNLSMDGRLTIVGNLAEPGIIGRISVIEGGYVYYIDRRFNITEGTLFNSNATVFNPTLRILAEANVTTFSQTSRLESFNITLSMSGSLEEPVIHFTSDPPLSELDILSILTFGERLGGMGGDMNNRLANITAQQVIGLGTRRLEKLLDVDRISVTGNVIGGSQTSAGGADDGVTIGVTRRFTDRLNIIYEVNTGTEVTQRATAQYRLLRNVYLEGETTGSGENAINLTFRYSR